MFKITFLIGVLWALIILATGCGISQADYDMALAEINNSKEMIASQNETIQSQNDTINKLNKQITNMVKPSKYFENRTAIEKWLNSVPKLGISKDVEQWYLFALYYQKKANEAGYYLSVSYTIETGGMSVTCDIITVDGYLFYFNPDNCILKDTGLRIDITGIDDLEHQYLGDKL